MIYLKVNLVSLAKRIDVRLVYKVYKVYSQRCVHAVRTCTHAQRTGENLFTVPGLSTHELDLFDYHADDNTISLKYACFT